DGVLVLPEDACGVLADDDGGGIVGFILALEAAAGEDADAGGFKVIAAYHVLARHAGVPAAGQARARRRPGWAGECGELHTRVAVEGHWQRVRQTGRGDAGHGLHALQQAVKESGGARGGVAVADRVERYQIQIARLKSLLHAERALDSKPEVAGEQEQAE